ncbi:MAG: hypothetical protein R3B46_01940 [Phycisphaerales bacterium]
MIDRSRPEENWYNGLGYRIVAHNDVDGDGDVDGSDVKFHLVYDTSWRLLWVHKRRHHAQAFTCTTTRGWTVRRLELTSTPLVFRERDANGNGELGRRV